MDGILGLFGAGQSAIAKRFSKVGAVLEAFDDTVVELATAGFKALYTQLSDGRAILGVTTARGQQPASSLG